MSYRAQPDRTKLRYVLYARKSTEDENRQVRSIDDQIKDCEKLARHDKLNIVEIIKESKSAKKPGQRPAFAQMLKGITSSKYDGIICWHPDRLCRNMLEGGQLINMLDENQLKDICFHSHKFSNDANGKMLLGMLFVFSKQYSDDLSDKVNRGVQGNLSEGKSAGTPKWGYTRSEVTGLYEPNEHFDDIKQAWTMRADGATIEKTVDFLDQRKVHRITKNPQNQRPIRLTRSSIGHMFSDPFYYGILVQSGQNVDLRDILPGFTPLVDKDTYDRVQAVGYGRPKGRLSGDRKPFLPLRGMVYCAVCNGPKYMGVGRNKSGSGTHYLSYRCDNKECERKPASLRAKHIFNSIYSMLEALKLSDEAYERYSAEIDGYTDEKIVKIKQEVFSKRGVLAHTKKDIKQLSLSIGRIPDTSPAYKPNMDALKDLSNKQINLENQIAKLEEKIAEPDKIKLSKEEFLNLVKTASDKMRAGSAVEKDVLCRILFLNLHVDNEKVASYHWREPFATLVKATEIQPGGGGRI